MSVLKVMYRRSFYILLNLLLIRKKKFYVAGMRRSGNHAFINWLKNALEGKEVQFYQPKNERQFLVTPTGDTVFINEVNKINQKNYTRIFREHLWIIVRSKHIIISTEDFTRKDSFKIPDCDYNFLVKRSVLNLIASRYKKLLNGINEGRGMNAFNIDDRFFKRLKKLYTSTAYIPWMYDEWLTSEEYRLSFLSRLNLTFDSNPGISKKGGGSSFSGSTMPEKSDLLQRYKHVEIPVNIINNLHENEISTFLTEDEKSYIAESYKPG